MQGNKIRKGKFFSTYSSFSSFLQPQYFEPINEHQYFVVKKLRGIKIRIGKILINYF